MAKNFLPSSLIITCPTFILFYQSLVVSSSRQSEPSKYSWHEEYYRGLPIDHFSYSSDDENNTFDMRYLVNDTWWNRQGGPVFFYPGNEGAITDFAKNTGLMWDWAPQFGALLVFSEHRYYGKSLPYGDQPVNTTNLRHLSVEQVMADYALLLNWLTENVTVPIIAFGGSYGGMLAAWMRVKYPHIITGALASSAPIMQLPGGEAPCSSFSTIATRTFAISGPDCDKAVKRAWPIFFNKSRTVDGLNWLSEVYKLCNDSWLTEEASVDKLLYAVADAWRYMAMLDYPYPADLLRPLPAWPARVKSLYYSMTDPEPLASILTQEACKYLIDPSGNDDNDTFLMNVAKAAFIFYNYTGDSECLSLTSSTLGDYDLRKWSFQACTELTFRRCQNATDMFRPYSWEESWFSEACNKAFGIRPKFNWLTLNYGIQRIKYATNIIFSSGDLDPWSGSGVTQKSLEGADPSLVVINIANAAHHYDLRTSNPKDTTEIVEARNRMKAIVQGWIQAYYSPKVTGAPIGYKPAAAKIEYERL